MAVVVESTSSANVENSSDIVITKPTGLAADDLMIAFVCGESSGTFTPPTGWSTLSSEGGVRATAFYKTATSADASASDFTFAKGSAGTGRGIMYRISGHSTTVSLVYDEGNNASVLEGGVNQTANIAMSVTPSVSDSLLIHFSGSVDGSGDYFSSSGTPTITGGTNPTWTEVSDAYQCYSGDCTSAASAYGTYDSTTEITQVSVAYGIPAADTINPHHILAVVTPAVDGTGTTELLEGTPTTFEPTAQVGTTGTATLLTQEPTVQAPGARVREEANWNNVSKGSDTWTNDQI